MRLIDADVADKWMRQNNAFIDAAILKAIPTIGAVPVVRCGECSKKNKNICPLVLVQFDRNMKQVLVQKPVPDDFFCAYGQRKEADFEVKPRFTEQEVERAKAIKAIWPNAERIEHPNTSLYVYSGVNFLTKIPESTFPSIQQGQTCNIEDIIDAEKD